jgi:hypothetical protein
MSRRAIVAVHSEMKEFRAPAKELRFDPRQYLDHSREIGQMAGILYTTLQK